MPATHLSSLSLASASITGPIWVAMARGSPTLSSLRRAGHHLDARRRRSPPAGTSRRSAEQRWPAERNAEAITSSVTCSGSAVASTIMALMPPVSAISGTIGAVLCGERAVDDRAPTSVEPVKATPATPGSATRQAADVAVAGDEMQRGRRDAGVVEQRAPPRRRSAASAPPAWPPPHCRRRAPR